jgi:hypothetical protein
MGYEQMKKEPAEIVKVGRTDGLYRCKINIGADQFIIQARTPEDRLLVTSGTTKGLPIEEDLSLPTIRMIRKAFTEIQENA